MKKYNPTSPGRRQATVVSYDNMRKNKPHKSLVTHLQKHSGRNNQGRITTRHQGGGHKKQYRMVDFKQNKIGVWGKVERIEYDPYRTSFIALVIYSDGERRYIIAPDELKIGDKVITAEDAELKLGVRTSLKRIATGTFVHNVELAPGRGGKLGRSAGTSVQVLGNEEKYTHLKLSSGEVRKALSSCLATIGKVSNPEHMLTVVGKAGRARLMGVRPTVRGTAMNPVDHPYGGGEGRTQRGTRKPKTKWGKITGGRKTRKKKNRTNKLILKRRK